MGWRVLDLYHSGDIKKDAFLRFQRPLAERRAQLEEELPRMQAALDVLKIDSLSQAEATAEAVSLATQWDKFSFDDKRAVTEKIVAGADAVAVNLLYKPPSGTLEKRATLPSP